MTPDRDVLSDRSTPARFTIRWNPTAGGGLGGYLVSIPNLDAAEVVLASKYDRDTDLAIKVIEDRERDMYAAMAEADRLRAAAVSLQNRVLELAREAHDLRVENERLMDLFRQIGGLGGPLYLLAPNQGERPDPVAASVELRRILTEVHKSPLQIDENGDSHGE